MHLPTLHTHRLTIRQFEPDDWSALYAYASDPDVMQYVEDGALTETQAQEFAQTNTGVQENKQGCLVACICNLPATTGFQHSFDGFNAHWIQRLEWNDRGFHFPDRVLPIVGLGFALVPFQKRLDRAVIAMNASRAVTFLIQGYQERTNIVRSDLRNTDDSFVYAETDEGSKFLVIKFDRTSC